LLVRSPREGRISESPEGHFAFNDPLLVWSPREGRISESPESSNAIVNYAKVWPLGRTPNT